MPPSIHKLTFDGPMNGRGFWLYVWKIQQPEKGDLLYVGRTGDSSSPNASSPIKRMGQHLDAKSKGNMLHRKLEERCIEPVSCPSFELVSYGPLFEEVKLDCEEPQDKVAARKVLMEKHKKPRDIVGALEKALADSLQSVGYKVMNQVPGKSDTESQLWHEVLAAFEHDFPKLKRVRRQ